MAERAGKKGLTEDGATMRDIPKRRIRWNRERRGARENRKAPRNVWVSGSEVEERHWEGERKHV